MNRRKLVTPALATLLSVIAMTAICANRNTIVINSGIRVFERARTVSAGAIAVCAAWLCLSCILEWRRWTGVPGTAR